MHKFFDILNNFKEPEMILKGSWGSQNLRATDLSNQNKIYLFETQQVLNNHVSKTNSLFIG